MAQTVIQQILSALPQLPPQMGTVARYVVNHSFEAATTPMRRLARKTRQSPATFTRLAQSLGHRGWDDLRALLVAETQQNLLNRPTTPYSARPTPHDGPEALACAMLHADAHGLAGLETARLAPAASVLENATNVMVAGFRSCHAPAMLFHYLYRLFRTEVALIGGAAGVLDIELGGLHHDAALVLFGFAPYSRDSLLAARAAVGAKCKLVAIVDSTSAPIAESATVILTFGTETPGFFPSLTACTALVQAFAACLYIRAGAAGRKALRQTEARIAAHIAYLHPDGDGT
jgi:DNA-binding MurR/RpiR family transcriptional regulator